MGRLPKKLMNTITEQLKDVDASLMEMQEPTDVNYSCFNTGGVETVVGEFLYGFVRMLRPNNIFETGTHMGISSSYIGLALKHNRKGYLTTVEIENSHIRTSEERWKRLGIEDVIFCDKDHSTEYELEYDCELMFLDSEPDIRFHELIRFYPKLLPGGYVFIHDTPRNLCQGNVNTDHPSYQSWPFGNIPQAMKDLVKTGQLSVFHFGTPRGLTGFYKSHPDDYKGWVC